MIDTDFLKIGTVRIVTLIVLKMEQFGITMQY